MIHKLVIGKVDFDSELGRRQHVQILLDSNYELPSANSLDILKEEFGKGLDIGKVFHKNNEEKFYFAAIPRELQKYLPKKWSFILFENLNPEECRDYKIILKAIKKLKYKPIRPKS